MNILTLPSSLNLQGTEYAINADFRPCVSIMQIFERGDLSDEEKIMCMVGILYVDDIPPHLLEEAARQASWFLNCGESDDHGATGRNYGRLFSWNQDLRFIIAGIERHAGSIRSRDFFHWWDFVSAFMEVGECVFSTLVHQRKLRKTGKQSKTDKEWWADNKDIAELHITENELTYAEKAAVAEFYKLLEGGAVDG